MARDAVIAANPDVNFAQYDNDGNGYVDAFIVIHAGPGAEQTGSSNDIWSHKWVLSGGAYNADGINIYAYLTVPEDARIGVCCHELGHLLFGFPDLYDTDYSSEGVGNWCLMGGGSWNGGGDVPSHPSAWCKANQGWVTAQNQTSNATVNIADVKSSHSVYRLWKDGTSGSEYFLVENRQKTGYDRDLPSQGLLIWHIDESIASNTDENHPKVALEQADGKRNLELGNNRGDKGDPYPGSSNNKNFNNDTTPNSKSYGSVKTCVAVNNISASGPIMTADLAVKCIVKIKEGKEKELYKEHLKDGKDVYKDYKDRIKDYKDFRKEKREIEGKELIDKRIDKRTEKPEIDKRTGYDKGFADKPTDKFADKPGEGAVEFPSTEIGINDLEARLSLLEDRLAAIEPFIDLSLRPDLRRSALTSEEDLPKIGTQMQKNAADAKRSYDTKSQDS
jgi:immune inhibitor A